MSDSYINLPTIRNTSVQQVDTTTQEIVEQYGRYHRRSKICTICRNSSHMDINLMRARDHMSLDDIHAQTGISREALQTHFKTHFILSKNHRQIIELQESGSTEANEIVEKILEREIDLFSAAEGVLHTKSKRLNIISSRLDDLSDEMEAGGLEDFETGEFIQLHKLSNEIENDILKTYQIIDKKLFPFKQEELSNAVLNYKIRILKQMLEQIHITLVDFEQQEEHTEVVQAIRMALANRINRIEDDILKSGGMIQYQSNSQDEEVEEIREDETHEIDEDEEA